MMPRLILFCCFVMFSWLIRRDIYLRKGISRSIWVPILWMAVLGSRPVSFWFGGGELESTLEGSPVDRLIYFGLIVAALIILARRQLNWGALISRNWPIFLFYGYFLLSVTWANSPFASFKRWTKEMGNIFILLVILTESDPQEAFRAVFVRCGYVLIPLSFVFIRYFPEIGRHYNIHSGEIEPIGVTFQKNSLGAMVLVCGLVSIWDWFERWKPGARKQSFVERFAPFTMLLLGVYLLHLCDSKTSIVCLMIAGGILGATRFPFLRSRLSALSILAVGGILGFLVLDQMLGLKEMIVQMLGRDMTFTGRTDVWGVLLGLHTDTVFGTGFMSFWDNPYFKAKLPYWVAYSAHNGYIEIYLAGGLLGVGLLTLMLLRTGWRINRALNGGGDYEVLRFAIFTVALLANFSESNFACMTPVGFLFLIVAVGSAERREAFSDVREAAVTEETPPTMERAMI
jgi:exopolysaccharide production protein ExoQ